MTNITSFPTKSLTFGQVLRSELARLDISQQTLANRLDTSRPTVNNLINNKYQASANIANKLAEVFDRPVEFWLKIKFHEEDLRRESEANPINKSNFSDFGRLSKPALQTLIDNKEIIIEDLDENLIQSASIDLRVGKEITNSHDNKIDISKHSYWLSPQETILIETMERIQLPKNITGNIGGMALYAKQFIQYGIGYEIDPGFEGHIGFTITNLRDKAFRIHTAMPIISVILYKLSNESNQSWVNKNEEKSVLTRDTKSKLLRSELRKAIQGMIQTTTTASVIEHSIKGTDLKIKHHKDTDQNLIFEMFLEEIYEAHNIVTRTKSDKECSDLGSKFDGIWNILGKIEVTKNSLIMAKDHFKPLINETNSDWEHNLKNDSVNLSSLAEILGVSTMGIVSAAFDMFPYSHDQHNSNADEAKG